MTRLAAVVLFACFALAGNSQEADPKVTYSTVAVPVKRAVAEIAKATGAKIDVAGEITNEVVIISVTEAPLSALMDHLAVVTSGEWSTEGGVRWLKYSKSTFEKERRARRTARLARIVAAQKSIKEGLPAFDKPDPPKSEDADSDEEPSPSPVTKAIYRIVALMDAEALVDVEKRVVFSTGPTRMQRPLPNVDRIISKLVAEHDAQVAELQKEQQKADDLDPKTVEEEQREQLWNRLFGADNSLQIVAAPVAKLLLAATRDDFPDDGMGITFHLALFDQEGKILLSGSEVALAYPEEPPDATKPVVHRVDHPLDFSPLSMERHELFYGRSRLAAEISGPLLERLLRPDVYDPRSFMDSEALLVVARVKHVNVVANLPDGMPEMRLFGPMTVETHLADLRSSSDVLEVDESEDWIVIRPADPIAARDVQTDRRALAALAKAANEDGLASLEGLAAYFSTSSERSFLDSNYVRLFARNLFGQDWEFLRLYGLLSSGQRELLRAGKQIPVRSLSTAQKELITDMVYGALRYEVERPGILQFSESELITVAGLGRAWPELDYHDEPTELMPAGLPPNATVSMSASEEGVFLPLARQGEKRTFRGPMSADDIAARMYQSERFTATTPQAANPGKMGKRTVLTFEIHLMPGAMIKGSLYEDAYPKDAPVTTWDTLPKEFLERVKHRVEAMKSLAKLLYGDERGPYVHAQLKDGMAEE
ncbi:MAG: hypothetical protein H0W86_04795 [Armatimonadetes bacterium]|nr:hypothetical protein [Armatimonadota bacterium]